MDATPEGLAWAMAQKIATNEGYSSTPQDRAYWLALVAECLKTVRTRG